MRTLLDLYSHYSIPPNLQRHQLEVAAVAKYICSHWNGEPVDEVLLVKALLLHDMGNIIKFKRPFLGELEADANYWEQKQDEFTQKYGSDVHTATVAIIQEIGASDVLPIIEAMRNGSKDGYEGCSTEVRIAEYADCCVTPEGIVGFNQRLKDLLNRYNHVEGDDWTRRVRENAQYVEQHLSVKDINLGTVDFSEELEHLKKVEI